MELIVEKIKDKIELDTTPQGCTNDCLEYYYEGYSEETTMAGVANCFKTKYTAQGNIFF